MMRARALTIFAITAILGACAQTPPVIVSYPATSTTFTVRIVRTVGCDAMNQPVLASSVTTSVTHGADTSRMRTFRASALGGAPANRDLKFEFYADGRLKGLNATTTGQGEAVIKAAIKLAEVALDDGGKVDVTATCKALKAHFGDKPLTLAFEIRDDLSGAANGVAIKPDWQSADYYERFKPIVGEACLRYGAFASRPKPVAFEREGDYAKLTATQPGLQEIAVAVGPLGNCEKSVIWSGIVPVAHRGVDYDIPVPRAALFGKQSIAVGFDEAGTLTSLQYGSESGAASAIGTAQAAFDAMQLTRTEKIADLKGEADLIAAQQRLVKCQTTPASC